MAVPCCGLLAAAAAERFGLTWLTLDPLALRLAEDCWVADGWALVAAEKADAAAGVDDPCLGGWARNGIIA